MSRTTLGRALLGAGAAAALALSAPNITPPAFAQSAPPIGLNVDATRATQGILFVHETIPVAPGALTLWYPKWIPGEHAPNGEIQNLAGVVIHAGGPTGPRVPWTRDLVDLYAFHLTVPAGTSTIDVSFEYLGAQSGLNSANRLATPNIMTLTWNKVILTPAVPDYSTQIIAASVTLPSADWKFATALDVAAHVGPDITFQPVTQEKLVDSPLDAGINERTFELGAINGAPVDLAAFADTPEELQPDEKTLQHLHNIPGQYAALYHYRHFDHYTFLLTVSDVMPGQGVEHHQSSDDGSNGMYLVNDLGLVSGGALLTHEFNHSWDGKYRRPADLATPNLNAPMEDDLLWVYEGMTQFYGNLQSERSGFASAQQWLDSLALDYANYDAERGRDWRPLVDTATSSSFLYGTRGPWGNERRGVDYYGEGALMWLEADTLIHKLTGGRKSLDDLAALFFGNGHDTGPMVVPYTRADLIAALNQVAPYDWATFFHQRVDAIAPHPPDFLTPGGYKLIWSDKPSDYEKLVNGMRHTIDVRYSLGLAVAPTGTIVDVVPGSVAYEATVGPGEKIVAVNGRTFKGQEQLDGALRAAENGAPIALLLEAGNVYRTVSISYRGGPRYPHLERIPGTDDVLGEIAKPK
jgi:predicted metalloprotease with PDZ domain